MIIIVRRPQNYSAGRVDFFQVFLHPVMFREGNERCATKSLAVLTRSGTRGRRAEGIFPGEIRQVLVLANKLLDKNVFKAKIEGIFRNFIVFVRRQAPVYLGITAGLILGRIL